jgi:hypothetical protein
MRRKEYEHIAEVIKGLAVDEQTRHLIAWSFALKLAELYVSFRSDKFVLACGVPWPNHGHNRAYY